MDSSTVTHKRKREGDCCADNPATSPTPSELFGQCLEKIRDLQTEICALKDQHAADIQRLRKDLSQLKQEHSTLTNDVAQLEEENDSLNARCGFLERTVRALAKNNVVEYKPLRSNILHNDLAYSLRMETNDILHFMSIKSAAKTKTDTDPCRYNINADQTLPDEFLPVWQYYSDCLNLSWNIATIHLRNVQLTSKMLKILGDSLVDKRVSAILLENNDFAHITFGIDFAATFLTRNMSSFGPTVSKVSIFPHTGARSNLKWKLKHFDTGVRCFGWADNVITRGEDVRRLVNVIDSHPFVDKVRLDGCLGGDTAPRDLLSSFMSSNKKYTHLSFAGNRIEGLEEVGFSTFLSGNKYLIQLYLQRNRLSEDDIKLISKALKSNDTLQVLGLEGNRITDDGYWSLFNVVFDNTTLNSVAGSNNTCEIKIDPAGEQALTSEDRRLIHTILELHNECIQANISLQAIVKEKLSYELCRRNTLGITLDRLVPEMNDDDPLALTCHMLRRINECFDAKHRNLLERRSARLRPYLRVALPSNERSKLSILFDVVRESKMPQLFERRAGSTSP